MDTIFLNSDQVLIIVDDMMVIGYQQDEHDHDVAFTNFLETAKKNNIKLNYEKFSTSRKKLSSLVKNTLPKDVNPAIQKSKP